MANNTIKEVFEEKINKNRIHENVIQKINKKNNKVWEFMLSASLATIVFSVVLLNGNVPTSTPIMSNIVNINRLDTNIDDYKLVDIAGRAEDISLSDLYEKYNFTKNISVPTDFEVVRVLELYNKKNIDEVGYNHFTGYNIMYRSEAGEGTEGVDIFLSETEEQRIRCMYILDEEYNTSVIKGVDMKILSFELNYIVLFNYQGVNYDIEAHGLTENELISLLESIII